jgi:hypothetical protein
LREGVLILALASLGVPAEQAIVPSLIFGLGILVVTLPGAWVWLTSRKLDPAEDEQRTPFSGVGDDSNSLGPVKIGGASNKTTGV